MNDDLAVYKPVFFPPDTASEGSHSLRFFRESHHTLCKVTSPPSHLQEEDISQHSRPLRALSNVSGLSTVFMPGNSGRFIVKTSKSPPHSVRLRGEYTRCLSGFDSPTTGCVNGFVYVDFEVKLPISPNRTMLTISLSSVSIIFEPVNCLQILVLIIPGLCARLHWMNKLTT